MVLHVVLFRPRPDIPDAGRRAFLDALNRARCEIPTIRRFSIGRRVTHGRDYERAMTHDFTFAAVVEFDDLEGLKTYLEHPAHTALGQAFTEAAESALVYDYEVLDALA